LLIFLHCRRTARAWAGGVGLAGALMLVGTIIFKADLAAHVLLASWGMMGVAYLVGWRVAGPRLWRRLTRRFRLSNDAFADLSTLERGGPREYAVRLVRKLERPALALPLATLCLLAPLSLHLVVATLFLHCSVSEFSRWCVVSAVVVGHAHITLLIFSLVHVKRLRAMLDQGQAHRISGVRSGMWALTWTSVVGAIPGGLLYLIPPILVFLTGLLFVPLAFCWAAARAASERQLVESCLRPQ